MSPPVVMISKHALDYDWGGVHCTRCGATDIEAAADPQCCGEDRWGIWNSGRSGANGTSLVVTTHGWCTSDGEVLTSSRRMIERASVAWRYEYPDESYSVRRYTGPKAVAPHVQRWITSKAAPIAQDAAAATESETEWWGVWVSEIKYPYWMADLGGLAGSVRTFSSYAYADAQAKSADSYARWAGKPERYSARPLSAEWKLPPLTVPKLPDIRGALNRALDVVGRGNDGFACEVKKVETGPLARAIFATDERVVNLAVDRGEYRRDDDLVTGAARYEAVIAKAWELGGSGKKPESEWRAEAEKRAEAVSKELARKP